MTRSARVTAAVAVLAYAGTLLSIATPLGVAFGLVSQLIFVLPGVLILRAVCGPTAGWLIPVAFGPLTGHALSSVVLMAFWAAGGRGAWLLIAAPALTALLALPARRLECRWTVPAIDPGEWVALGLLLLLVPLVVGRPFANVGAMISGHEAYRAYFTADYVWRRAVVIELAKGDFLPRNPYFENDTLHYYWLPHLMNAVEYRATRAWFTLDSILLTRSVMVDGLFVAFLYGFARMFRVRPWSAATATAAVVLCSSYEGTYVVARFLLDGVPLREVRNLNIDAISRWWLQSMPVDGLQRLLMYQPHHAAGYAMGLLGLLALSHRSRRYDPAAFVVAGILLGLSTLISSFAGLMVTSAAAVFEGVSVLRHREWRRGMVHAMCAAIPLGLSAGLVLLLHYVDQGGSPIELGLNPVSTHNFFAATVLSAGPMLLVGGTGAWLAWRERQSPFLILASLATVSVAFYFFVDIKDHQHVYVGWRVGHFLFMSAIVTTALLLERAFAAPARIRVLALGAITAVLAAALPTSVIDLYNTQDIWNWNEAPSFRWTLLLTPEDQQVFTWLQAHTGPEALVQVDPTVRDTATWAYLPAFAERRMAVGLPISMVPLAKYLDGSDRMRQMFDADPRAAYDTAMQYHIDYIIVGPPERDAHPGVERRFDSVPALLPLVLRNATISVYKVIPEI